jgi:dephospho-CoA kinase
MLKVGLTGNIGSGKTVVAKVFSSLGIPVFHADNKARALLDDDRIKNEIRLIFGDQVFSPSGEVRRPALAEIVFSNQALLEKLNSIIHPEVRKSYRQWCLQPRDSAYTLYEAAILFESGHYQEMDKIICVVAPEEMRISRVMERDGVSRHEVEMRIASQWPEEKKAELADYIIKNDGSSMIISQVLEVHNRLLEL